jgi:hypothetical protein
MAKGLKSLEGRRVTVCWDGDRKSEVEVIKVHEDWLQGADGGGRVHWINLRSVVRLEHAADEEAAARPAKRLAKAKAG